MTEQNQPAALSREDEVGINPDDLFEVKTGSGSLFFRFGTLADWRTYRRDRRMIEDVDRTAKGSSLDAYYDEIVDLVDQKVMKGDDDWTTLVTQDQLIELYWGLPTFSVMSEREAKKRSSPAVSLTGKSAATASEASAPKNPPTPNRSSTLAGLVEEKVVSGASGAG